MRRILSATVVCLTIFVLYLQPSRAVDQLTECDGEPTDMTIGIGSIVNCAITPVADSDLFRFNGTIGEKYRLTLTDLTFGGAQPIARLFDPDDALLGTLAPGDLAGTALEITLQKTGLYTIVVNENGDNNTVNYRIALQRLMPPPPEAQPLCFGCVLTNNTIDPIPDSDVFLFDGTIGDQIRLTLTDLTFGGAQPIARLFDPDDALLGTLAPGDLAGTALEITLQKTGLYTIVVNENGDNNTVAYNLALQCLNSEPGGCLDIEPPPDCDDDSGQLDIRTTSVAPGDQNPPPVPVEVNTAPNELRAFGFEITFDPTKLTFASFTRGPLTQNFDLFDVSNPAPGVLRIAGVEAGAEPIAAGSSGTIVNLTFLVDPSVPSGGQLPLQLQNLVDNITPFTTSDGCIITGCLHDGDVDMNGQISPQDALLAFQFFLEQITLTDCQQDHADVEIPVLDPGSDITPADALCIFNKFLQKPSCLDG